LNGFGAAVVITGCGSATPGQFLSNEELSQIVETSDEWIKSRTGIGKRHLADRSVSLSQLAAQAAIKALEMAQVSPRDIDLILLATSTPEFKVRSGPIGRSLLISPPPVRVFWWH